MEYLNTLNAQLNHNTPKHVFYSDVTSCSESVIIQVVFQESNFVNELGFHEMEDIIQVIIDCCVNYLNHNPIMLMFTIEVCFNDQVYHETLHWKYVGKKLIDKIRYSKYECKDTGEEKVCEYNVHLD
jgi:hypothetical protein